MLTKMGAKKAPTDRPCPRCGCEYTLERFRFQKNGTRYSYCITCKNEAQREWCDANPEKVSATNRAQYKKPGEKEKRLAYNQGYRKTRAAEDPEFKIGLVLKRHFQRDLRYKVNRQERIRLTGCSMWFLSEWLAAQFRPGMSWENYGTVWHIDHKKPRKSFNLLDAKEQHDCYHYSNLQPLFALENLKKGAKHVSA